MDYGMDDTQPLPFLPPPRSRRPRGGAPAPLAAIGALVLGIAAFVLGWVPVLGLVIAGFAIFLAVWILTTGFEGRTMALVGLALAVVGGSVSLFMATNAASSSEAPASAQVQPTVTVTVTATPVEAEPTVPVNEPAPGGPAGSQVTIPALVGTNAAAAKDLLDDAGLTRVVFRSDGRNGGVPPLLLGRWTVTSVEPAAGTTVPADSTVVVTVKRAR